MKKKNIQSTDNLNQKSSVNKKKMETYVQKAMNQYNTTETAARFNCGIIGTKTDHREKKCVIKILKIANIPAGSHILDLPCGAGRLLPLLKKFGYKITGADISNHMLLQARRYAGPEGENCLEETDNFQIADVFNTGFKDKCFDAVLCHRLFQYFPEPELRQQALKELKRVSKGPIIVSFKCNLAANTVLSCARKKILCQKDRGCKPIGYKAFAHDAKEAGLVVKKWFQTMPLLSERWYAVLVPDNESNTKILRTNSVLTKYKFNKISRIAVAVAAVIVLGVFLRPYIRAIIEPDEVKIENIVKKYQDGDDKFYIVSTCHSIVDSDTDKNLSVINDVGKIAGKIIKNRRKLKDSYFFVAASDISKIKNISAWACMRFVTTLQIKGQEYVLLYAE
jgi:ubiquinone/menaquinone biosynthesis C-methylase UbiE